MDVVRIAAIVGTKLYIDGGSLSLSLSDTNLSKDISENSLFPPTRTRNLSLPGTLTIGDK